MKCRIAFAVGLSLLIAGCAVEENNPPLSANHPANCNAPESRVEQPSQTLALGDTDVATARAEPQARKGDNMQNMDHPMPGMKHDHGSMTTRPAATTQSATKFTCKMHPEVVSDKPGKCPKCAMTLVPMKDAKPSVHGGHQ